MIPIIINNRNRVSTLQKLIDCIPKENTEIIILDNDSTYEPLLDFYASLPQEIKLVRLGANLGQEALYRWDGYKLLKEDYFIYTDPDIVISEECPKDFLDFLLEAKKKYKQYNKIGLSLRIDDLPDHYAFKKTVIDWESKYWQESFYDNELNTKFWIADVDTTFAIYDKNNYTGQKYDIINCLRTNFPYVARHLPWYIDSSNIDLEERYYMKKATARFMAGATEHPVGMWTQMNKHHEVTKASLM